MLAMLEMVTMKSKGQKTLSPIHLISLVDPKAKWLKAWIHGNLGRQLFFNLAATTHDNLFFKTAMHHLLVTMERDTFPLLSRQSHYREVVQGTIFYGKNMRFGLILGRLAILKKTKLGRL